MSALPRIWQRLAQLVSRESDTATSIRDKPSRRSNWIFDPIRDLALVVATPLVILPLTLVFRACWSDDLFVLMVAAFGQLGHTFPGLLRAYGDRPLFRRYRTRFLVAPVAIGTAAVAAVRWNLDVLVVVGVTWAVWHALMQCYGFIRIYAAKQGDQSIATGRFELAICVTWFVGAILLNERPLSLMLSRWYGAGGPLIPATVLSSIQFLWAAALVVATVGYAAQLVVGWHRGSHPGWIRLMMLISGIGFYWFAYAGARNILIGAAMFELFHDIQYLAIVWFINRKRAEQREDAGAAIRFLFRQSGALLGFYIGLVFAFGAIHLIEVGMHDGLSRDLLTGLLATAGILHYYYDGFIWKIRDPDTRQSLGIGESTSRREGISIPGIIHLGKWCIGLVPVLWLVSLEVATQPTELKCWTLVRQSLPQSSMVCAELAARYHEAGLIDEALVEYQALLSARPNHLTARLQLARCQYELGHTDRALAECDQILCRDRNNTEARILAARILMESGRLDDAENQLRRVLDKTDSLYHDAHTNLAIVLAMQGRLPEARRELEQVIANSPTADAHFNLAHVLLKQGEPDLAKQQIQTALDLNPALADRTNAER